MEGIGWGIGRGTWAGALHRVERRARIWAGRRTEYGAGTGAEAGRGAERGFGHWIGHEIRAGKAVALKKSYTKTGKALWHKAFRAVLVAPDSSATKIRFSEALKYKGLRAPAVALKLRATGKSCTKTDEAPRTGAVTLTNGYTHRQKTPEALENKGLRGERGYTHGCTRFFAMDRSRPEALKIKGLRGGPVTLTVSVTEGGYTHDGARDEATEAAGRTGKAAEQSVETAGQTAKTPGQTTKAVEQAAKAAEQVVKAAGQTTEAAGRTGKDPERKPVICLLTNWYPTEENPYFGLFFRDQAMAMGEKFDFLIVHYTERIRRPGMTDRVRLVKEEGNIREYAIEATVPAGMAIRETLTEKMTGRAAAEGGAERSARREAYKREKLISIFETHFREQVDYFYCVDAQREAADVRALARRLGKPYVVGEHGPVPWPGYVIPEEQKQAIVEADGFLAISRDKIRQMMMQGIRMPKVTYVGNLVDEERFTIREQAGERDGGRNRERSEARAETRNVERAGERGEEQNCGEGADVRTEKVFLTVGAHSFYKNYDLLIDVMNRVAEGTEVPFRVLIVGYGANRGYSRNAEELEQKIRESRFAGRTEMIPAVPHEEMAAIYHRADALIVTSVQEGQPVAALEAACCGLPIFSTRCGGVEDYTDGETGRIYAIDDGAGMAKGLIDYLEGRIGFDGKVIRDRVVGMYGRAAFAAHFAGAFEATGTETERKGRGEARSEG